MNNEIIVALISLIGIIVSAVVTKNNLWNELDKRQALIERHMEDIDKKLIAHNSYAEKFASVTTDIKLIQQDIKYLTDRFED